MSTAAYQSSASTKEVKLKLKVTVKLKGPDQEWSVRGPGQLDQNRHCWVKTDKGTVLLLSFMKCGGVGLSLIHI